MVESLRMHRREFEAVVDRVLDELPDWVVERIDNLIVVVEEHPTQEQDPDRNGLLGVYEGVNLLERSGDYWGAIPDQITIFRQPHLRLGLEGEELEAEIRKTVLHEIAHHIGIDDDRLHELGWD
ncbi:MAG: metallopeptidase family protein [Acidimicrobiia bacterium]